MARNEGVHRLPARSFDCARVRASLRINCCMRFYLRAISYFKADTGKIALSLIVIAAMTLCGLLQVYPFAILSDSVFSGLPPKDWVYRLFLAISPSTKVGQIISLSLIVLGLRLVQE